MSEIGPEGMGPARSQPEEPVNASGPAETSRQVLVARVLGLAGIAIYNWWFFIAVTGKLMTNTNEFFSDLEAVGHPHADVLQQLDLVAGAALLLALLLRGSRGTSGVRKEWKWLVGFAVASIVGGRFGYACSEGLSAACRRAEWHFQLPMHHYVHVLAGIAEFACASTAIFLAWKRTREGGGALALLVQWVAVALFFAYPLLAVAHLSDHLGAFIEPVFFISFSVMVAVNIFEPA